VGDCINSDISCIAWVAGCLTDLYGCLKNIWNKIFDYATAIIAAMTITQKRQLARFVNSLEITDDIREVRGE
jgi:hypothetical protein